MLLAAGCGQETEAGLAIGGYTRLHSHFGFVNPEIQVRSAIHI